MQYNVVSLSDLSANNGGTFIDRGLKKLSATDVTSSMLKLLSSLVALAHTVQQGLKSHEWIWLKTGKFRYLSPRKMDEKLRLRFRIVGKVCPSPSFPTKLVGFRFSKSSADDATRYVTLGSLTGNRSTVVLTSYLVCDIK